MSRSPALQQPPQQPMRSSSSPYRRPRHSSSAAKIRAYIALSVVFVIALAAWTWVLFWPRRDCFSKTTERFQENPVSAFPRQSFQSEMEEREEVSSFPFQTFAAGDRSLELRQVVFGIAGSVQLWKRRKEFVRMWWRPGEMRGYVWLEKPVPSDVDLPSIRVSEDISRFSFTNPSGRYGIRIARIVLETFKLGLTDVKWFVLADDDTVFNVENLIAVLRKYDSSQMYYVGSCSESHSANTYFSHEMAFGGGGIALSYPLVKALSGMLDECLQRYTSFLGSDDRLHACISELGVPLTREPGFHQWDVRGNAHGLLSAHPIVPFVSFHHLESVFPIFPNYNSIDALKLLTKSMRADPTNFLQQSICYDHRRKLSISVSMGYVVQVFPGIIMPRELERPELTFTAWNKLKTSFEFDFNTRPPQRSYCKKPLLFYFGDIQKRGNITVSTYKRDKDKGTWRRNAFCLSWALSSFEIKHIQVFNRPLSENWYLVPRRQCCQVIEEKDDVLGLKVGPCEGVKSLGSAIS